MEHREEDHIGEDKHKRSSIFTVKDAEGTLLWFCFYVSALIIFVIAHQIIINDYKFIKISPQDTAALAR